MFRVALESVLGVTLAGGDTLCLRPCVPCEWPSFTVRWRLADGTRHEIAVAREDGGGIRGQLDEAEDGVLRIPLARDGESHRAEVLLGRDFAPDYVPRAETVPA
jgi:N,N'-diacetylchitobiose phosphorylase